MMMMMMMMMMTDKFPKKRQAPGDCSIQQYARIALDRLNNGTTSQKWELWYKWS